jgi:Ricin-type beta-trefoil lectin domain
MFSSILSLSSSLVKNTFVFSTLLLVSSSLLLQTPLMVKAQEFSDDPVVMAQMYLDRNTIIHTFSPAKNYAETTDFLSKKTFEDGTATVFLNLQIGENQIDIPVQYVKNQTEVEFNKSLEIAKQGLLGVIKSAKEKSEVKTELQKQEADNQQQGGINYNFSEASEKLNLDEIDSTIKNTIKDFKLSKVTYIVKSNNQEIGNIEKDNSKKITSVEDKKVFKKKSIVSVATSETVKPTEEYKKKVLAEAQTTKEGIARKQREVAYGKENQKLKDERVKEQVKQQKKKAKEIKKLIKEGKKNQIKVMDIYELGEESQKLGLEIKVPEIAPTESELNNPNSDKQPKILINESKAVNYQEEKEINFLDNVLNFGSVKADAFSPEQYWSNVNHAKPTKHFGTSMDIWGGNTIANGTTIGTWYRSDSAWNQKFHLNSNDTITNSYYQGKCIDLNGNNATNGAKIQLWDCNGSSAQQWVYDTEGLLRLKRDISWCVDTPTSGDAGNALILWQCGSPSFTEGWRAGNYEMRLYARRGQISSLNVGHGFVQLTSYDSYNNVNTNTTYSLWPDIDTDNQNQYTQYKEYADRSNRGSWDNVNVNHPSDLADGYDGTQNNDFHAYSNRTSYWKKNITSSQFSDIINNLGFEVGNSTYSYFGYYCTNYSKSLWLKYGGIGFYSTPAPIDYYYVLLNTQIYS